MLCILFVLIASALSHPSYASVNASDDVWAMQLAPGVDPVALAYRLGLVYIQPVQSTGSFYIFRSANSSITAALSNGLPPVIANETVTWSERQAPRQQSTRTRVVMATRAFTDIAKHFGPRMADKVQYTQRSIEALTDMRDTNSNAWVVMDPLYQEQWHLRSFASWCRCLPCHVTFVFAGRVSTSSQ
jgi:hypothetical protein